MGTRLCKILMVMLVGLYALLAGINNLIEYNSNFLVVQQVLSMGDTSPESKLLSRAITLPATHHVAYWIIILGELVTGVLCLFGGINLAMALKRPLDRFEEAKALSTIGLTAGFTLWFFGFLTLGGQWFQMGGTALALGQDAAFHFIACSGLVLVFLNQAERPQG